MNYFEQFPVTSYDFGGTPFTITHILRRFNVNKLVKDNIRVYDQYHIKDGETPDLLANRWYNDPYKYWIILMFNDIVDPFYGWPLIEENLIEYCKKKYGAANINNMHHYEDPNGIVVDLNWYTAGTPTTISNYYYESRLNDAKRKIRIPQKQHAENIAREAEKILLNT